MGKVCLIWIIALIFVWYFSLHSTTCADMLKHLPSSAETLIGKLHYQGKSLIICGLMRDCAMAIANVKQNITSISHLFDRVHILIVENDSMDSTREDLLEWSKSSSLVKIEILGCGVNAEECRLQLCKTSDVNGIGKSRIAKMVYLRNIYLQHIRDSPYLQTFDYCAVMDMDLIGHLSVDGLAHTGHLFETNNTVDAIATNGWAPSIFRRLMTYYDFYAYRSAHCLRAFRTLNPLNISVTNNFNGKPFKVISAFGGFAIYKTKKLLATEYSLVKSNIGYTCEHITVNEKLSMYLDPQFLFSIQRNICSNKYF